MERNKRRSAWLAAGLLAGVVLVYAPCLHGDFLWDDDAYISRNAQLTSLRGLHDIWLKPGSVQQYYPLTFTVFWIEYHLWGLHPVGYHLLNIVLHGFNALLLWGVLEALGIPGAWIAAWLFALHPVHAESVAWMTELKNVLSTFFYLLTVIFLIRFNRSKSSQARPYGLALLFFVCALLSKSVTATLPIAFLAVSAWTEGSIYKRKVFHMLPFIGLGLGVGLFTLHYEHHLVGARGPNWGLTAVERLIIAGRAFWFYLGKLAVPSSLAFIYPRWPLGDPAWLSLYPASALIFLGLLAYGQKWWGKLPFACLLFFVISLAPMLGFTSFYFMRYSFVADHFQYVASMGVLALAGWGLTRALERLQVPVSSAFGMAVVVLVCANLALLTRGQTLKYASPMRLWEDTLLHNPESAIAHHNIGIAFSDRGQWNDAIAHLRTAEALDPSYPQTHLALAYFSVRARRWHDARAQYQAAIRLGVRDPWILADFAALPADAGPPKSK